MLIRTMKLPPEETLSMLRYFSGLTSHVDVIPVGWKKQKLIVPDRLDTIRPNC